MADTHQRMFDEARQRYGAGDFAGALDLASRLAKEMPGSAPVLHLHGVLLHTVGRQEEARRALRRAIEIAPRNASLHHDYALTYKQEGKFDEAHRALDRALAADPRHAMSAGAKAELYYMTGEHDRALAAIEPALTPPVHPQAAIVFARLAPRAGREREAVDLLESALAGPRLAGVARKEGLFRLGDLLDRMGDYDRAFDAYRQANRIKAALGIFDSAEFAARVDLMLTRWTAESVRALPRGDESELPLFVLGMWRSGTTLVEQVLASHPSVGAGGELFEIGVAVQRLQADGGAPGRVPLLTRPEAVTAAAAKREAHGYLTTLRRLAPKAQRVTDKMPANFLHLGLIATLFPRARVIHCVRDPLDTCLSCFFNLPGDTTHTSDDLGSMGCYYVQYRRLMDHWRRVLAIPMLEVAYEEMVSDQGGVSRRIVEFAGLPWHDACLRFFEHKRVARTASLDQVRRPIYASSVGRWRNYEKHLGPLRAALGL